MKNRSGVYKMSCQEDESAVPTSNAGQLRSRLDRRVSPKSTGSLSETFEDLKLENLDQVPSPLGSDHHQSHHRLVQSCGPDCMITQRIVDKLLSRMLDLENERSELLAANRSWAVQFQFMKENYENQIRKLEERLKMGRRSHEKKMSEHRSRSSSRPPSLSRPPSSSQQAPPCELDLLAHQAEVYKEDFLEERKARALAHAQIESLRNELKRERMTRVQVPPSDTVDAVFT